MLGIMFLAASLFFACGDKTTNSKSGFVAYGRVAWRPPLTGLSLAEFRVFNDGSPVTDAEIVVDGDTIREVPDQDGLYRRDFNFNIGDTISYSLSTLFGSAQGIAIIPDTVPIVRPSRHDTLGTSSAYSAVWHANRLYDGYYAYLSHQPFDVGAVSESALDTTLEFPGNNLIDIGIDTFWVETLNGVFAAEYAPNGMLLPRGVVGAAGNYCEIYFTLD